MQLTKHMMRSLKYLLKKEQAENLLIKIDYLF